MRTRSRREFLATTGMAIAGTPVLRPGLGASRAFPLDGLLGLQANDVRSLLATDYDGTLRTLAGWGYRALDLVGLYGRTAAEVRTSLDEAGMVAHNSHYSYADLTTGYDEAIADVRVIGLESVVCQAAPGSRESLDGLRRFADDLNAIGTRLQREGLFVGYHNHTWEFRPVEGEVPFEVLVANTDPTVVRFQLDVGSVVRGGMDPIALLRAYPNRYYSLHVRDVRDGQSGLAVGDGTLDFRTIFSLAKEAGVRNYDVETGAQADVVMDTLRRSAEFLRAFTL